VESRKAGCEPMDKNRIGGPAGRDRASGPVVAKPISIKDAKRRFGGGARKAVELTLGDRLGVPAGRDGGHRKVL
jgi:hypothetical protein